ncbi:DUF2252 domain-containing protein [Nocardioides taihuensis]|uniref:DUF2252 domain-containing protein n=1 Tax=Nocardioides taihuensis TaxID=1835606 RepID=A0ABW0BK49_9ACTN
MTHLSLEERAARGRAARAEVPADAQADAVPTPDRADPVAVLEQQGSSRVPDLLPLRHARMAVSAFTFYRGAARLMALDLAGRPTSGLGVQACGDAHLSNFGMYASPERRLVFDLNDFDETHRGPWEWDLKRLVTSFVVAARDNGSTPKQQRRAALTVGLAYQEAMASFAGMRTLDVWYTRIEVEELLERLRSTVKAGRMKKVDKNIAKARSRDSLKAFGKLAEVVDGRMRFRADPPLLVPVEDLLPDGAVHDLTAQLTGLVGGYRRTLSADRRLLLDRFRPEALARKVVGVGSVGTRCWVMLLSGRDEDDPLFLQIKEAQASVLADLVPEEFRDAHLDHQEGERVVTGQRITQATSDIFLGWDRLTGIDGQERDFYVRQLRDMKGSALVEEMEPAALEVYARLCGGALARAHARSGDPVAIAAYLGEPGDEAVAEAMVAFGESYADQNARDHAAMVAAIADGRLPAAEGV